MVEKFRFNAGDAVVWHNLLAKYECTIGMIINNPADGTYTYPAETGLGFHDSGEKMGTFTAAADELELRFQMPQIPTGADSVYCWLDNIYLEEVVEVEGGGGVNGGGYRYQFNGKELDREVSATTTYDYGFRIYSPGLGRFLSVDPLHYKYPGISPYVYVGNSPLLMIDPDGTSIEPNSITVVRYRGTNHFKVTGEVTIKIQILNLSKVANSSLYLYDYKNRVQKEISNALNNQGVLRENNDVDLKVGRNGEGNKLVQTGRVRQTTWTYDINVNVEVEIVNKKENLNPTAHVIAIVNGFAPRKAEDIQGKPLIYPVGVAVNHTAFVSVDEIKQFSGQHTASHEFGHLLGLSHYWNKKPGDKNQKNLMEYYQWSNNDLTPTQIGSIWQNNWLSPTALVSIFGSEEPLKKASERMNSFNVKTEIDNDKKKAKAN